jgi:hypothetical protein
MRILTKAVVGSLTVTLMYGVVAATSLPFAKAEDQVAADAAKGRALTTKELDSIYQDRSWRWSNGAAYFRAQNRMFIASVDKGAQASYAEGSWSVSDQGRLCFTATWHGLGGQRTASTCFEHRTDDKNIYQRKLPDATWYVFSHLPALPDDEIQKLQPGDQVSEDYRTNKRYLAEHKDQIAVDAAKGRVLTGQELNSIYEDRSWRWNNGAAYFRAPNRVFIAWADKGAKAAYAEGSWSANDQGRLCFNATWHGRGGQRTASTCFEHRTDDKNIYQRKLPNGKWYVFSHLPALPDDGIRALQPGDHVSEDYQTNKRRSAEHAPRRKRR